MTILPKLLFAVMLTVLAGCTRQPIPTIIHICDYHFVDRDSFAADLRDQDESIPDAVIDEAYAEMLDAVESVQIEQMKILRELIQQQGVRRVFLEGLTDENQGEFRVQIGAAKEHESDLQRAIELLDQTDDPEITAKLQRIIYEFRMERLKIGAAGQLIASNELDAAIPLDDTKIMEAANPAKLGFKFDAPEAMERQAEMARRLLAGGPLEVCVLGGGHHLGQALKAKNPRTVYQRIEPETWQQAVGR